MSARVTFLTLAMLFAAHGAASAACAGAIAEFETIITSDAETGNLNKSVFRRVVAELNPLKVACAAGHEAEATRALATVKARYGYH